MVERGPSPAQLATHEPAKLRRSAGALEGDPHRQVVRRRCRSLGNSRCRRDLRLDRLRDLPCRGASSGRVVAIRLIPHRTRRLPVGVQQLSARHHVGDRTGVPAHCRRCRCRGSHGGTRASTWESLLATTLRGHEIITAKMLGAVWKTRFGIALLLALWSAGMLTGALHPLGALAALALLFSSMWFVAVLGIRASLLTRDVAHSTARTIGPLILLTGTFVICYWPSQMTSVVMGAGSIPFVNYLGLISHRDFAEAVGQGSFSHLTALGIASNEGAGRELMALLIAVSGYTAAAVWLTRSVIRRFD